MPDRAADVPDEVLRLASDRLEKRRLRDFAAADELRTRILGLGFRVLDSAEGFTLEPVEPPRAVRPERLRPEEIASVLHESPSAAFSVQWIVQGWPEDVVRGIASIHRWPAGRGRVQHVIVDDTGTDPAIWPEGVEVIPLVDGVGWAKARNCGLRRSRGDIVVVADGSIEASGDVLSPLARALEDPTIGIAGPFGIVTSDLREFHRSEGVEPGRDVDAIEGYLMAFRRETLQAAGFLDEAFAFYRSCDIEYSFRVKERGLRAVVVPVPVATHEHRAWAHTAPHRRDALSKRNFYRFLDRYRGRFDLTVAGRGSDPGGGRAR
jgi:cysteinyl-tRNA synthetase